MTLSLAQRKQARLVAEEVTRRLVPGCGSMLVDERTAAVFADVASFGTYVCDYPFGGLPSLTPQRHWAELRVEFRRPGQLLLGLDVDGWTAWRGVLRGPGDGA